MPPTSLRQLSDVIRHDVTEANQQPNVLRKSLQSAGHQITQTQRDAMPVKTTARTSSYMAYPFPQVFLCSCLSLPSWTREGIRQAELLSPELSSGLPDSLLSWLRRGPIERTVALRRQRGRDGDDVKVVSAVFSCRLAYLASRHRTRSSVTLYLAGRRTCA